MKIVLKIVKNPASNIDYSDDGIPKSICSSCLYYGGLAALEVGLTCTVHPFGPKLPANSVMGDRKSCYLHSKAYIYHDCQDFLRKPIQ